MIEKWERMKMSNTIAAAAAECECPDATHTVPERFHDLTDLARFVIEEEWALESEVSPSGRADWRETLNRVRAEWDDQTPDDIVSTIAAAVRLDRSFRGKRAGGASDYERSWGNSEA